VLSTIGALVCVIGGGYWQSVFPMFGSTIYIANTDQIQPPLSGANQAFLDYEIAIFNRCCVASNWTDEGLVGPCTGNTTLDCPVITNKYVTKYITNADDILCECGSSAQNIANFEKAVDASNVCALAGNALVDTSNLVLPNPVPGNLKLSTLTVQYTYAYTYVPLVGFNLVPDIAGAPPGIFYPYGCGLGYVKGLSWLVDQWHQQVTQLGSTACLAIGCVQWFCLILGGLIGYLQKQESNMEGRGKVDLYDQNLDKPASFYVPAGKLDTANLSQKSAYPPQQQQAVAVAAYIDSAHSSGKVRISFVSPAASGCRI